MTCSSGIGLKFSSPTSPPFSFSQRHNHNVPSLFLFSPAGGRCPVTLVLLQGALPCAIAPRGPRTNPIPLTIQRLTLLLIREERTVKSLRLSKALTVPETTTVHEACRRMAARKVDALLLTDSNALLCGILTDKDIATKVIAREVNLEETHVSKVMTRNPVFVLSDTLAVEALQKMVQGRLRHLPVVENGEVVAILDIAKCLYDAIARMERAADKGKAIAAAVEGSNSTFMETLREKIFKPSLSTIIPENSKVVTVSPTDSVLTTTKKMLELRASSAVVTVADKPCVQRIS